jgi:hypothetical protein
MLDSRALCTIAAVDRTFNALTNAETEVWRQRAHGDPSINICMLISFPFLFMTSCTH